LKHYFPVWGAWPLPLQYTGSPSLYDGLPLFGLEMIAAELGETPLGYPHDLLKTVQMSY
jgi:hypothetical protein